MAIITEEEEPIKESPNPNTTTTTSSTTTNNNNNNNNTPPTNSNPNPTPNPFTFWFYFTIIVSIITFLFASLSSSLTPQDPKSWFLSLPNHLRQHYSKGRIIKVQTNPNLNPIELFTIDDGRISSGEETVIFLHGLGLSSYAFRETIRSLSSNGVRAVAIDLPGSGFSDKTKLDVDHSRNGVLGRFYDVYDMIQEKGLFWAFDEIIATGQMPYEEVEKLFTNRKSVMVLELGPEEIGKVLGQVMDSMKLSPVHLVLHDSALGMFSNWVLENSGSLSSITLLDTASGSVPALPLWAFELPLVREIVLGFPGLYARFLNLYCSKLIGNADVEAHRVLLKGRGGRKALVGMAKKLNYSFDLAEWGDSEVLKGVPMQVLWSGSWSEEWSKEGRRVADALPQAKFVAHSGGRWPQEDASAELAEKIVQFISSLPKSVRKVEDEPIPEHIQKMFDEAKNGNHEHGHGDHHHHHDGHAHVHGADFRDAYGLDHGWGS